MKMGSGASAAVAHIPDQFSPPDHLSLAGNELMKVSVNCFTVTPRMFNNNHPAEVFFDTREFYNTVGSSIYRRPYLICYVNAIMEEIML